VLKRLIAPRVVNTREHRAHRFARAVTEQAEEVAPKRAALRDMAEAGLEWLQPRNETIQPRRRGARQHCAAAYRNSV
jgi:hypothetical protein